MSEQIQFWGVLLWMIAMLILAAIAVRAVWHDATRSPEIEPGNDPEANPDPVKTSNAASGGTDLNR
jgi:hypothetical protein